MSYSGKYEYTTTGNVKVKNYVASLDKRNGLVAIEFDARGHSAAPYPQAYFRYDGADKTTIDLSDLTNAWKRYRVTWYAASRLQNKDWGDVTVTLKIEDQDDTEQLFNMTVGLDLDPAEFHMSIVDDVDFGDDSTPGINFTLTPLHNKNQKITPIVTSAAGDTDGGVTITTASGTTASVSGLIMLNGVTFDESTAFNMNSGSARYAYWSEITNYFVDTPTLSEGDNTYSIDLVCENI